jgi:hypothetical protein
MAHIPPELALASRERLPADLLDLLAKYPRESWPQDPHLAGLAEMWLSRHGLFRQLSGMIGKATSELREGAIQPDAFLPFFQRRMGLLLGEREGLADARWRWANCRGSLTTGGPSPGRFAATLFSHSEEGISDKP